MKASLLLLSLFGGLCCGQPGLEYHYRYSGRVAAGITDVRHQFSAAGIQADVTVQVAEDYSLIFQFTGVEVGEFHDELTCDVRAPLPIEYHRLQHHGVELLEKPFKATINGTHISGFLEVPTEPAWITNIRKAVVNIFRISPFGIKRADAEVPRPRPESLAHLNFGSYEETMVGRCTNWYNIFKLPEDEAAMYDHDHELEDDAQREGTSSGSYTGAKGGAKGAAKGAAKGHKSSKSSKTSKTSPSRYSASNVPDIDDTLWSVTRTTDFDDCESLVSMKGHVNHHTEDLFSRSSIGSYIIRGNMDEMRIERAVIEGTITLFTQDDHREHYDTFTNQTLELKVVRPIGDQLTIDYESHRFHSWSYEVDHEVADHHDEKVQPSLEQILTGVEFTEEIHTEVKRLVTTLLQELADWLPRNPTNHKNFASEMSHLVEAISLLRYQDLEEIYQQVYQEMVGKNIERESLIVGIHERKSLIFKQAMIETGTEPAITFLLDKIPQEDFRHIDYESVYNFFTALPTSIKSPSYIPKLMEVVMQLPWYPSDMALKSIALIGFSKLANGMCFSSERRSTYWDVTCEKQRICNVQAIIDTYLPYLQQGIENEEAPSWQRFVYMQALTSLGTPQTISILKPYILGTKENYLIFRKDVIWSCNKDMMPSAAQGQIFDLLMPVFENIAEHHEVRIAAFITMATWEVTVSWWQRMAMATWHDPSHQVANFISTTIKTTAHMKTGGNLQKMASRVEHLTKPASPSSISHSANYYLLEYVYSNQHGRPLTFAWLANSDFTFPTEIYIRLKTMTIFGVTHVFRGYLEHYGEDVILKWLHYFLQSEEKPQPKQDAIDIVVGMFHEMKENLGFQQSTKEKEESVMWNIQDWLGYYNRYVHTTGSDMTTLEHINLYVPRMLGRPSYHQRISAFVALPTDLGLPYLAQHTYKAAWWIEIPTRNERNPTDTHLGITVDLSCALHVETKTLVPWSEKFAVGTGSDIVASVVLPLKMEKQTPATEMQLHLQPETNDKVHVFDAHNFPFTVQHGGFPTFVHHETEQIKTVKKFDHCQYSHKHQVLPPAAGLWLESEFKGDVYFPFDLRNIFRSDFHPFTPTLESWEYHVLYDPEASTTKSFKTTFTYVSTDKTSTLGEVSGEVESLGQESQSSSDYSDYSQFSQSSSDYEEGDAIQSVTTQRIAKIQQQVVPSSGGHVQTINFDFDLYGIPNKKYAALFTFARGTSSSKESTKAQFTWIKDIPEGVLDEPHATCLNFKIEKPRLMPFLPIEELLETDYYSTFKYDLHDGVNCELPPVLEVDGTMDVSPEQMIEAIRKLTEDCAHEHPIDLITSPLYDHLNVKAHWTEGFNTQMMNFTYHAYDLFRGVMFPEVHYDYTVTNPDHKVEVDYTKCLETQKWNVHSTKPHENAILQNVRAPYLFEVVLSPAKATDTLIYDFFNGREHEACVITQEKIRTFDGVEIPFHPDECWSVITMEPVEQPSYSRKPESSNIEVRFHDGHWEARLTMPKEGLLLEMTKDSLKVNGEDFRGKDPRFDINYLSDGAILSMPYFTGAFLKISDKVYYLEDHAFKNRVIGLCGDFDGEKSAEMVGPKGCVYSDPELFVNSWKTPGEGCSGFSYLAKKKPVEDYQGACPHRSHVPTGVSYPEMLTNDCTIWHYEERTEGSRKCWALIPTPKCQPHCHPVNIMTIPMKYDCETTEDTSAPKCFLQEYTTSHPWTCVLH